MAKRAAPVADAAPKKRERPPAGDTGTPKKRGRPPAVPEAVKAVAEDHYLKGYTPAEIAAELKAMGHAVTDRTVRNWAEAGKWKVKLGQRREMPHNLDTEIARLAAKKTVTMGDAQKLAMLSKTRQRMRLILPTPKPRPVILAALHADLLAKALAPEYGLRTYQTRYLTSTARFLLRLKARQIGFSYSIALKVTLKAAAGRPQLVVSASERQAKALLGLVVHHAQKLGITPDDVTADTVTIAGTKITALPPNAATIQGFPGDVTIDEAAWIRNLKKVWEAIIPSITSMGGTVEVNSTPFLPGSFFWKLATNHENRWGQFDRETITIHDAIAEGMEIPGGVEELQSLFEPDSWAMMYLCQWAEDGAALLSWAELEAASSPVDYAAGYDGPVWIGIDVGRTNDRTIIVAIGRVDDRRYAILDWWELHQQAFSVQRATILQLPGLYPLIARGQIDRTGMGRQLAEEVCIAHPGKFRGVDFSSQSKERWALNLQRMVQEKTLILPNDPGFLVGLHSVKKIAGTTGMKYEAARDANGHGDEFWGTALAADGLGPIKRVSFECEVW
ncbi:MAG: hypothetical protein H7Z12_19840 [Rhodospirillaceae bacterium]|nr:hypothetical protein [Rhodospirillales bacterium]